jgi:hypothetical protein
VAKAKKTPKKKMAKKPAKKRSPVKKATPRKAAKKKAARKIAGKKTSPKKKAATLKAVTAPARTAPKKLVAPPVQPKPAPKTTSTKPPRRSIDLESFESDQGPRGAGSEAAGQSGDLQGLSRKATSSSESVEELVEEGQAWEASAISGVEDNDGDPAEVRTHEVPEDDVPEEYLNDRENE